MARVLASILMVLMLAGSVHAASDSGGAEEKTPEWQERLEDGQEALKDTLSSLLGMLEGVVSTIPQYEAPEVLENGDIIIRRKRPEEEEQKEPEPEKEDGAIQT